MTKFLETVADFIIEKYKGDFKDLTVILPNRRAGLFLEKHLAARLHKTAVSPLFFSIDDFVFAATGLVKASSSDLVFDLYEVYANNSGSTPVSFDDFSSWGPKLINDFNDIDNYLADNTVIFNYLSEARNLQRWNLDKEELSSLEKNYLAFYKKLNIFYNNLRKKLLKQNTAYSGLAIRKLTEDFESALFPGKNFIIAGFNALTPAEEKLFEFLSTNFKTDIFWDADNFYLSDKSHEAGKHIRKNLENRILHGIPVSVDFLKNGRKKINIRGLTGDFAMVKYAAQIIEKIEDKEDTAIVLANEELLFPLLNSLPPEMEKVNITMSYPFQKSDYYDLNIRILELYESMARQNSKSGEALFYYGNLFKFIYSPIIKKLFPAAVKKITALIAKENISLVSFKELAGMQKGCEPEIPFDLLDVDKADINKILKAISDFNNELDEKYLNFDDKVFFRINKIIINRLRNKVSSSKLIENAAVLKKLYKTLSSMEGIPFEGIPLAGLQIMGLLETRALDFRNIIYISFNEGFIPRNKLFRSFILPEIRREFGMPLPNDDDAVTAYHFYRSIQRAEDITLIYNTEPGRMGGGEISRYAAQIRHELKDNKETFISEEIVGMESPAKVELEPIIIEKDDTVIKKLLAYGQNESKGFSPTSLATYLSCSLKFYFSKVLDIRATDEVEEEIAANTRGNIVHKVLEDLYRKEAKENNRFDKDFYEEALKKFPAILDKGYKEFFKRGDSDHGNNLLFKKLDYKIIEEFLKEERIHSQGIENVECEVDFGHFLTINIDDKETKIRIFGHADRIDTHGGQKRIIDYKTGKAENKDLDLGGKNSDEKWEMMMSGKKFGKAFQLLTYVLLHNRSRNYKGSLKAMIAALKYKNKYLYLNTKSGFLIDNETVDKFEEGLKTIMEEIFDRRIPFSQTEDKKVCKNCNYKNICNVITE